MNSLEILRNPWTACGLLTYCLRELTECLRNSSGLLPDCVLLPDCLRTAYGPLTDCLRTACGLLTDCLRTAYGLLTICLRTACGLLADCLRPAYGLHTDCLRTAYGLLTNCLRTAYGLLTNCLRIAYGPNRATVRQIAFNVAITRNANQEQQGGSTSNGVQSRYHKPCQSRATGREYVK